MGNSSPTAPALAFLDRLIDPRFGEVDLYRTEDARFVMRLRRTHVVGEARHSLFKRVNEWLKGQEQQYVVPIMHLNAQLEKGLCIQLEQSEVFTEYFNFTLLDLLRARKELDLPELWLLLHALLTLTDNLRKHKLAISLKLDNVFLTLKGLPCVYSHHFLSFEESVLYSDNTMAQQVAAILLQLLLTEEISLIECQPAHLLPLLSRACSRDKCLGTLVKQLLSREKNEEEVLQEIESMVRTGQITKSAEIKLNKFKYALPEQSSSKKTHSNAPIEFKPRKASSSDVPRQAKDSQPRKEQVLSEVVANKQATEQLFEQLQRRKEEARGKMERAARRKEALLGKENRQCGQGKAGLK